MTCEYRDGLKPGSKKDNKKMSLKNLLKDSDVFGHLAHKGKGLKKPPRKLSHKQTKEQTASLRKKPTFLRRHERRDSMLMTCHYPDIGSSSDWFKQISLAARPIRSTFHILVVERHQYGISALVHQTPRPHFAGKPVEPTSRNVGCFLRLTKNKTISKGRHEKARRISAVS